MKMVGHHLQSQDLHLGVVRGDTPPLIGHALAEFAELCPWRIGTAGRGIAAPYHPTKERTAAFGGHGHHVHHAPCVVVIHTAALHGWPPLAGKGFLTLVGFSLHRGA